MLCLLLFLSALSWLRVAAVFEKEETLSNCDLRYYGQTYSELYLASTADEFIICFKGKYGTVNSQDCIFAPPLNSDTIDVDNSLDLGSIDGHAFKTNLASLPDDVSSSCSVSFVGNEDKNYELLFAQYGKQTALKLKIPGGGMIKFMVNDAIVDTVNSSVHEFTEVSGCRSTGMMYKPNEDLFRNQGDCTATVCSSSAELISTSCEADLDRCQSNGFCILDPVCTVIGPSIIGVKGAVGSIPDRCTYTLMRGTPISGLEIQGWFQERRRKNVYFLKEVILHLSWSSDDVFLGQGSRVWAGGEEVTLNSTAQSIDEVELSKTEAGVTAKLSKDGYTITVFFDDYTAQITLTGEPGEVSMDGLCYNPDGIDDFKDTSFDTDECSTVHTETDYSEIDRNTVNDRCEVLADEPFSACSDHIDPNPFIRACKDTLSEYPAVDSIKCQFFETYTRICSERRGETLEDWRPGVDCPSPQAFCQGRACSANEFCAETISGETACFCRAIYASSYRSNDTWGDPMSCDQDSGSITLLGCLLEENGIDYSALHLTDENCEGEVDQWEHKVTFSFSGSNTCGTVVKTNDSHMIFENTINNQESSTITRDNPVEIKISCAYPLPEDQTMGFKIKDNSVVKEITTGAWNYKLTMKAYTDEHLTQAVGSSEDIELNEKIWVELNTEGLDDGFVALVTDSCWATNQESADGDQKHDLFKNGCANTADPTVKVYENGQGTSNHFSFNMFEFTGLSGDVYLHCKVNLCTKLDGDCAPDCNPDRRRRRSPRFQYTDEASALITLVWTQ